MGFGVFEIFYGLPWSKDERESYAGFLKEIGFQFYLYGPKADETLRRNWHVPLAPIETEKYRVLRNCFHEKGLKFGMALSPQGLNSALSTNQRQQLQDKVKGLSDLGIDILGLFFDDMKSAPEMAERQLEIVHLVRASTSAKILFCPSYYCYDSLLDLLFGDRPAGYLEALGNGIAQDVEILWTGEQIISPEIGSDHLRQVASVLKRKPFVCDNFYANDGPINCSFLRVLPPSGRPLEAFQEASGWALNPMNQAHLSKLVLLAFAKYALQGKESQAAYAEALQTLCSPSLTEILTSQQNAFATAGQEAMVSEIGTQLNQQLSAIGGPFANEIIQWLNGKYIFGLDAMIDQSCFDGA